MEIIKIIIVAQLILLVISFALYHHFTGRSAPADNVLLLLRDVGIGLVAVLAALVRRKPPPKD